MRRAGGERKQLFSHALPAQFPRNVQGAEVTVLPARTEWRRFHRTEPFQRAAYKRSEHRAAPFQRANKAFGQKAIVLRAPIVEKGIGADAPRSVRAATIAVYNLLTAVERRKQPRRKLRPSDRTVLYVHKFSLNTRKTLSRAAFSAARMPIAPARSSRKRGIAAGDGRN